MNREAHLRGRASGLTCVIKAVWEWVAAAVLLLGTSPLMAIVAVLIKIDTPGPVLFTQRRTGLHGRPFWVLKFRTMRTGGAEDSRWATSRDDPRITRVGRVLRRSSLDELPQLINVLRGEMALIGPRPAPPHYLERYTPRERRRLLVRPGLTGLAQVRGRNTLEWDRRLELDVWYVEHWSLLLDARILMLTPLAVLSGTGVYGMGGRVSEKT